MFLVVLVVLAFAATNSVLRVVYTAGAVVSAWLLTRAWQLAVIVDDRGVTVQEMTHREHYAWNDLISASTAQLGRETRFSKPSHVALAVRTRDGRLRRFNNVSASEVRRDTIDVIAEHINARCLPLE